MDKNLDNNKPLISVIINCYNGEKYLRETIDSVLNQSYQNWEIVFWDNNSTDQSANILKSYKENRIKYFYTDKHRKLYDARNLAYEKSQGDFFVF
jgi:glycosyltransferase involved in cell wall biosynthesis